MFYDYGYESPAEYVAPPPRRSGPLSFTYSAGEVRVEGHSSKSRLCCSSARLSRFRVYHRDTNKLIPRGICCVRCDTEYLDRDEYPEGVFDSERVEVHCLEMVTDFEDATDDEQYVFNVKKESFVFHRVVHLPVKLPPFSSILTMVNPNRKYINHRDPGEIEGLRAGTHVMWHRPYTLWHHQLIRRNKGDGKCDVIHFDSSRSRGGGKVEVQEIEDYDFTSQNNGTAYEIVYDEAIENSNPLKLIIDRAHSQLMEIGYCPFRNNCEHMVAFCKTGSRRSLQINWLKVKLFLFLVRILILTTVVAAVGNLSYFNNGWISKHEEYVELGVVSGIELILFLVISLYWSALYKRRRIVSTDRWRRIIEAGVELVITVLAYGLHVMIFIQMRKNAGGCRSTKCLLEHIFSGIGLGILGKGIGCMVGQATAQCLLSPGPTLGVPSAEYGGYRYGSMGYSALAR